MSKRARYRIVTSTAPPFVMYNNETDEYYGYSIDLLHEIQALLDFDYDINESTDGHYGYRDNDGKWNGMIYDLMTNQSDLAVGPIWIGTDRAQVVDFTIPYYKHSGFSIMTLKRAKPVHLLRFLMVLEKEVWFGFAFAFLLTTLLLYTFERYSPSSYTNSHLEISKNDPDARFASLKECFWFACTSLTPQGGGRVPKNYSGKVAAATWWLFGFVIFAAYTANLGAYETLDRLERNINSLDDLRRQYSVEYSTRKYSTTYRYFLNMKKAEEMLYNTWKKISLNASSSALERTAYAIWEYPLEDKFTKMFYVMEEVGFLPDIKTALNMVKKVDRTQDFAYIEEALTIRYLMLTNCEFKTVGEEFSKKPFAFAVQKGSPLKKKLNAALNTIIMERKLERLEKKWWDDNPLRATCPADREFNAGFGFDHLAGVFLLILVGVFLAAVILCFQYFWYYYLPRRRVKRLPLARRTVSNPRKNGRSIKTISVDSKGQ